MYVLLRSIITVKVNTVIINDPRISMAKCLSIRQPYAELIISGRKTIELRKWNTGFRGEFLVHASKVINKEVCKLYNIDISSLITGAILGSAALYDVKLYEGKKEFIADQSKHFVVAMYSDPKYGFLLSNPNRFDKPIPLNGRLGFFNASI